MINPLCTLAEFLFYDSPRLQTAKDEADIRILVKALDFYRTLNNYTYEPGRESNVCKDMGDIAAKGLTDTGHAEDWTHHD